MALNYSLVLLLLVLPGALAFIIIPSQGSMTHADITRRAIVRQLAQVCRSRSSEDGAALGLQDEGMSAARLLTTCFQLDSLPKFVEAFKVIKDSNVRVDIRHFFDEEYHFDSESFEDGRSLITSGLSFIKGSIKQGNFREARERLGQICHPLQDFYSHSNWIELGNTLPNSNLLKSGVSIGNIADVNTPTCTDCEGDNCQNNILAAIIQQRKLTSGYFSITSVYKPDGKCSHGGSIDLTSLKSPVGGINKDKTSSSHGHLHNIAAEMATNATVELLEDIRVSVGDSSFLRLMGITRSSVLCFVIGTTGGMSDVIKEAKRVASSIIDGTQGTANEPSDYVLVAFNSSNVGPLLHTTDSGTFRQWMSTLTTGANGTQTVLSLSAIEMALRAVPVSSYIFVFTDAPAKDSYLMSTVTALIESTHSVVNFMLTNPIVSRWRRSYRTGNVSRLSNPANQLYQELAQASGGLAIEVTAASLPQATNVIVDSTTSALVTLLQATRNPGKADDFSFMVDTSVQNMRMYITGSSLTFTLQNPSGVSQNSGMTNGPLGTIQAVGNLYRVELNQQVGLWTVSISSSQPYSLKVTGNVGKEPNKVSEISQRLVPGQSSIDFRFDFVRTISTPVSGYIVTKSRPNTGGNATLLLTVISSSTLNVTEVSLVEVLGSGKVNGTVKSLGQGDYLVSVDKVPDFQFGVRLAGLLDSPTQSSNTLFQRQSNTQPRSSNLTVTAQSNSTLQPGSQVTLPFTVTTGGTEGTYTILSRDDRGFITSYTNSLNLVNGSAQGVVNISIPGNTSFFSSDTTVTIVAESPGTSDTNYVVLHLSGAAEAPILSLSLGLWVSLVASLWHLLQG